MDYFKSCVIHLKEQNTPTVIFLGALKQLPAVISAQVAQTLQCFVSFRVYNVILMLATCVCFQRYLTSCVED